MSERAMSTFTTGGRRRAWLAGFTLIELMITVAIVAILGAVALPAYRNAVLKGQRAEGRAALIDFLQQQERFFTQNNTYMVVAAGATGATIPFKTHSGDRGANAALYWLSANLCPGTPATTSRTCIQVVAERRPSPAADPEVGNLNIISTGKKNCTGTKPTACWP